ncbi:MAG: preprotein translocase subunit SecG [Dehalococcoidia bacterium]|nr:preprotein translocase subunit SecG [Dehalococcoidia bacterium]
MRRSLIVVVLLQVKGSGFGSALGGMSGGGSTFRTKRGLERTLFQATILLVIVFIFVSFLSVQAQS